MSTNDKPLVWLAGEVKSPPFSAEARLEAGFLTAALAGWGISGNAALEADALRSARG